MKRPVSPYSFFSPQFLLVKFILKNHIHYKFLTGVDAMRSSYSLHAPPSIGVRNGRPAPFLSVGQNILLVQLLDNKKKSILTKDCFSYLDSKSNDLSVLNIFFVEVNFIFCLVTLTSWIELVDPSGSGCKFQ